jgi:hypothetical protein
MADDRGHHKSQQELRDAGFLALREALGPDDALRFIRLYRPAPGDFTEERLLPVGTPTIEELTHSAAKRARWRAVKPGKPATAA